MWHTLPVVGQVVRLNPEHEDYDEYNRRQARGDLGVITRVKHEEVDIHAEIARKLNGVSGVGVSVQWQNGHSNAYRDIALLPVVGAFLDFRVIANYPYTTEQEKRQAEYAVFMEGSTRFSKVRKETRSIRQSDILDVCTRHEANTEKDATIIANLMYNTKLQMDYTERIIPTDTFFSRAEYLFNKEEEGNLSSVDMRGMRDVNTFVMERQLIADSEELASLYKRELPVATPSFTEDTSTTTDVGAPTQVVDDTLRRADESYGDWISRMVISGTVLTEEMMNNAQNPRQVRRRVQATPRGTPLTRTALDEAFTEMLAGNTRRQVEQADIDADGTQDFPFTF